MVEEFILFLTSVISFLIFKNTVMKSRWGKDKFDTRRKIIISEMITAAVFLATTFLLESTLDNSEITLATSEGLFIGWATSLAGEIRGKNR